MVRNAWECRVQGKVDVGKWEGELAGHDTHLHDRCRCRLGCGDGYRGRGTVRQLLRTLEHKIDPGWDIFGRVNVDGWGGMRDTVRRVPLLTNLVECWQTLFSVDKPCLVSITGLCSHREADREIRGRDNNISQIMMHNAWHVHNEITTKGITKAGRSSERQEKSNISAKKQQEKFKCFFNLFWGAKEMLINSLYLFSLLY